MTSIRMNEPVIKYWLEQLSTSELDAFNALVADILAERKRQQMKKNKR